ncbi:MAG: mechanosensitive ion channel family protein [Prochlorotrichaceae cyanobacterium]
MENFNTVLDRLPEGLVVFGLKIIAAIVLLIIGLRLSKIARRTLDRILSRQSLDVTLTRFAANTAEIVLVVITFIIVLGQVGIQTASFLTVIASAGLAIGLALQGSLSNLSAGVLLILFRPFSVGHFIEFGGVMGTVEEIQLFVTLLATPDNRSIIVPNSKLISDVVINYSTKSERRIDLEFGVAYSADLDRVKSIIESVLASDSRILSEPAPTIGVIALAESSVNFAVRPWVKSEHFLGVLMGLQETLKKRFDQEGIEIPFPQREIRVLQGNLTDT